MSDPTPMQALLTQLGYVVSSVMGWITNATDGIAATIVNTPLLLVTTGFLVLGGAIGIFGRLLSKN